MPGALSPRESEVLALLGEHLTHAEIADRLVVSVRTVESHVASARRKLGIDGHRELVRYAAEHRPRVGDLPLPLSSFVGRAEERSGLSRTVREHRLVSLVGPGGVGKTRLAIEVGRDISEEYAGRVWLADLVPVTDGLAVAGAVVAACRLEHLPGRFPEDVLARGLGGPPGVLIVDNCEHLLDPVAVLVERLLSQCPGLHVLLTSRARLALPFERVHQVRGLPADGDAVELFEQRAVAAGGEPLDDARRARVAAVCDALGGLALAIELAAVRLPVLGLDGLERGLTGQLELLVGGARLSPRQRSMAETLDWSLRLLDATARTVLARLSCFAGGFDVSAAVAIAGFGVVPPGNVPNALAALVELSLVVSSGSRWRLLEPVRQYAAGRSTPDDVGARERHREWAAARCVLFMATPEDDEVPGLADEVRAALAWAASRPTERIAATQLATSLAELLFRRGAVRDAQLAFEQAAAMTDGATSRVALLTAAAATARCRVLGEEALRLDVAALESARVSGQEGAVAACLAQVAETILRFEGMFSTPTHRDLARDTIEELELLAARQPEALAAVSLVRTWSMDPEDPGAELAAVEVVERAHRSGDAIKVSAGLDVVTFTQVIAGRLADADSSAQRRLRLLHDMALDPAVALEVKDALHMAVQLDYGTGSLARSVAEARRHRALPFLREQRDLALEPLLLPAMLVGHHDELFEVSEQFAEDWAASGSPPGVGRAVGPYAVAVAHAMRGHADDSRRWYGVAAALRDRPLAEVGRDSGYADVLDALLMLHRDQPARALRCLSTTHEDASPWYVGLFGWWRAALRAEAAVLGDEPDAARLLAEAERLCLPSETLSLVVRRTRALATADGKALGPIAERFEALDVPYQSQRTRLLADR